MDNEEITALKKQIASLNEQISSLKNIIALMPGSVYWRNRQGINLGCNINQARILGLATCDDIIGKTNAEVILDKEIAEIVTNIDNQIMDSDQEQLLEEIGNDEKGERAIYLTRKTPLHNGKGEVIGILGSSFDITERKKIEEELKILKEKEKNAEIFSLKKIIALMPGNIYWKDRAGKYKGCNENIASILKLKSTDEIIGKTPYDLVDKKYADILSEVDEEIMAKGTETLLEEGAYDANGNSATYITRKLPLYDEKNHIVGLVGISFDITDRKKMEMELIEAKEKAEAANRAKSDFLSVASHELRTPLTGILGLARFLVAGNLTPEEEQEYHNIILNSGSHLLSIINDILDFSKLDADQFQLTNAPLDLKALLEEITSMLTAPAKAKGLDLRISYGPALPHCIFSDARALKQIFVNLIGNAIKFTNKGHVEVRINCIKHAENQAKFEIAIEDTGIGIPEDKLEFVFGHFQQLQSAMVRAESSWGTGLGLSITKKLVELMDGTIKIYSTLGQGSTFLVTLNFPLQNESIVNLPWSAYATNVRVLIVDDTARGKVLRNHISSSFCETVTGNEALYTLLTAQHLKQPFDIIIIDQELHTESPQKIMQRIKSQKELHQPMGLLLTLKGTQKDKKTASEQGFFDIIIKPIQPIALQVALTSAWERWHELHRKESHMLKILLIEDDKVIQLVHKRMLTGLGCQMDIADTGQTALDMLANHYDLVFVDLGLPDISGIEVMKKIRQRTDSVRNIPLIALTGYTDEDKKQACLEAGANEVIAKPATVETLQEILKRYK